MFKDATVYYNAVENIFLLIFSLFWCTFVILFIQLFIYVVLYFSCQPAVAP